MPSVTHPPPTPPQVPVHPKCADLHGRQEERGLPLVSQPGTGLRDKDQEARRHYAVSLVCVGLVVCV